MCRLPVLAFYLLLFTGHCLSDCPAEWTQLLQSDKCVKAFGTQLAFFDAMLYCQNAAPYNGGSLVSIHNAFQNAQLGALGQQASLGCPFWIGLYDFDDLGQYSWTDQTNMDYTNWASGYPTASAEDTAAFMNLNLKNRWEDTNELSADTCFFCQQNSNQAVQTTTTAPVSTTTNYPWLSTSTAYPWLSSSTAYPWLSTSRAYPWLSTSTAYPWLSTSTAYPWLSSSTAYPWLSTSTAYPWLSTSTAYPWLSSSTAYPWPPTSTAYPWFSTSTSYPLPTSTNGPTTITGPTTAPWWRLQH